MAQLHPAITKSSKQQIKRDTQHNDGFVMLSFIILLSAVAPKMYSRIACFYVTANMSQ
jgi:Na+/melibiose symporter-like transporter